MFLQQTEVTCFSRAQGKEDGRKWPPLRAGCCSRTQQLPSQERPIQPSSHNPEGKGWIIVVVVTETRDTQRQITVTATATHAVSCVPRCPIQRTWGRLSQLLVYFSDRDSNVFMSYLASGLRYQVTALNLKPPDLEWVSARTCWKSPDSLDSFLSSFRAQIRPLHVTGDGCFKAGTNGDRERAPATGRDWLRTRMRDELSGARPQTS